MCRPINWRLEIKCEAMFLEIVRFHCQVFVVVHTFFDAPKLGQGCSKVSPLNINSPAMSTVSFQQVLFSKLWTKERKFHDMHPNAPLFNNYYIYLVIRLLIERIRPPRSCCQPCIHPPQLIVWLMLILLAIKLDHIYSHSTFKLIK